MLASKSTIKLGSRKIDYHTSPYIIAEIGVNHEGSLERAKQLISLAARGGAHAAKFQTYKAEKLASKYSPSYWDLNKEPTLSQFDLFKKYDLFEQRDYEELASYCANLGIDFLSTPFDDDAVDFLEHLVPFYKIASADINNVPMLRRIAKKRKPVVLSTGASTIEEINFALGLLKENGVEDIALLHCVLNYPTPDELAHLWMIEDLRSKYPEYIIGYSDHTIPNREMSSLTTAYLLGARILEKHFTDDKTLPGNDHYHAMDIEDLLSVNVRLAHIKKLLGNLELKAPLESESISRLNARRSVVFARDLRSGHVIAESDITYKRPGTGISVKDWDQLIGSKLALDVNSDEVAMSHHFVDFGNN